MTAQQQEAVPGEVVAAPAKRPGKRKVQEGRHDPNSQRIDAARHLQQVRAKAAYGDDSRLAREALETALRRLDAPDTPVESFFAGERLDHPTDRRERHEHVSRLAEMAAIYSGGGGGWEGLWDLRSVRPLLESGEEWLAVRVLRWNLLTHTRRHPDDTRSGHIGQRFSAETCETVIDLVRRLLPLRGMLDEKDGLFRGMERYPEGVPDEVWDACAAGLQEAVGEVDALLQQALYRLDYLLPFIGIDGEEGASGLLDTLSEADEARLKELAARHAEIDSLEATEAGFTNVPRCSRSPFGYCDPPRRGGPCRYCLRRWLVSVTYAPDPNPAPLSFPEVEDDDDF